MSEKLTIQDLARGAADTLGMTKGNAELFVKEFFQLIADALHQDKYVKVKGLGTFKLIEVDSRSSVHIKTGERIEIQGHTKVSFTPDAALRDIINRPFAHFETVPLQNEELLLSTTVEIESSIEEESFVEADAPVEAESSLEADAPVEADAQTENPPTEESFMADESPVEESPVKEVNPLVNELVNEPHEEGEPIPLDEVPAPMDDVPAPLDDAAAPMEEDYPPLGEELQAQALKETLFVAEESAAEEPASEEPVVEEAAVEEPAAEEAVAEEPAAEEAAVEEAVAEEPAAEEPVVEKPATEEAVVEEAALEEAAAEEASTGEAVEETVVKAEDLSAEELVERKNTMRYFIGIVVFVSLLCIGVLVFIYFPGLTRALYGLKDPVEQTVDTVSQPVAVTLQQVKEATDSLKTDTLQPVQEMPKTFTTGNPSSPASQPAASQSSASKPVVSQPAASQPSASKPVVSQPAVAAPFVPDSSSYEIVGTQESYTLKEGETLTRVSLRYWGTKKLWPYLVKHNPTVIKNPDNVPYGTTIKIPKLKKK